MKYKKSRKAQVKGRTHRYRGVGEGDGAQENTAEEWPEREADKSVNSWIHVNHGEEFQAMVY